MRRPCDFIALTIIVFCGLLQESHAEENYYYDDDYDYDNDDYYPPEDDYPEKNITTLVPSLKLSEIENVTRQTVIELIKTENNLTSTNLDEASVKCAKEVASFGERCKNCLQNNKQTDSGDPPDSDDPPDSNNPSDSNDPPDSESPTDDGEEKPELLPTLGLLLELEKIMRRHPLYHAIEFGKKSKEKMKSLNIKKIADGIGTNLKGVGKTIKKTWRNLVRRIGGSVRRFTRKIGRWVKSKLPRLRFPRFKIPRIGKPRFKVKIPRIRRLVPRIKLPPIKIPRIRRILPRIRAPRIRFRYPRIKLPRIRVRYPRIRTPRLRIRYPRIRIPRLRIRYPRIRTPRLRIRYPRIRTPRLRIRYPRIRIPRLRIRYPRIRLPRYRVRLPRIRTPRFRVRYPRIRTPRFRVRYPRFRVRYPRVRFGRSWGKKKKRSSCDDCERISNIQDKKIQLSSLCPFLSIVNNKTSETDAYLQNIVKEVENGFPKLEKILHHHNSSLDEAEVTITAIEGSHSYKVQNFSRLSSEEVGRSIGRYIFNRARPKQ